MNRVVAILCVIVAMCSQSSLAQRVDENCNVIEGACKPTRNCNFQPDLVTSDCRRAFSIPGLFPGTNVQKVINDPVCEAETAARNASQEAKAAAQRADCERLKAQEFGQCLAEAQNVALLCKAGRSLPGAPDGLSPLERLVIEAKNGPTKRVPEKVINLLSENENLKATADTLSKLIVAPIPEIVFGMPRYATNRSDGFTIGDVAFISEFEDLSKLPIRFWLFQGEMYQLFSLYGIESLSTELNNNPSGFYGLIDRKIDTTCEQIEC